MRWSELVSEQPRLGDLAHTKLLGPGVVLVATIRRDGTPRLSPVEPFVMDGQLWLSMMWHSTKAADLARDPRVLVHNIVTGRDGGEGEVKLRGTARTEISYIRYDDATGDQFVTRWPAGREFVRHGTSATTVGPAEP